MHWIAQYVTFDRVSSGHLDDSKPIVPDINDFANASYLLNKEELQQQRSEFIILVGRVLLQFFPATKAYLCTAFKTWAGLDKLDGVPENLPKLPKHTDTIEVKKEFIEKHFGKFVDEYVLVEFDVEKTRREGLEERRRQQQGGQRQGGQQQPEGQAQTEKDTPERNTNANNHLPSPGLQSSGVTTSRPSQCCEITVGMLDILDKDVKTSHYQLKMVSILNNFVNK